MPDAPEKRRKEDLLCINPERGHRSSEARQGKQRCGTPEQDGKLMLWLLTGMGHPNTPQAYAYTQPRREKQRPRPSAADDGLNDALGAIRVLGLELIEEELKPHLNTVLSSVKDKNKGAAEQVVVSGILPILALSLRHRGPLTLLTAKLVAQLAKEPVVRKAFGAAGLVPAVLSVLASADQELLLYAARAVSRMCHDSPKLQELLLRHGAVPRLVAVLLGFPAEEPLEDACLLALCNLSGMGLAEEAGLTWERGVSARPGESLFHAVSPRSCGFTFSLIQVRVSQWAAGQHMVNVELSRRYSSNCWSLCGNTGTTSPFPLSHPVTKVPVRNLPQSKSLKTRMFHTFL